MRAPVGTSRPQRPASRPRLHHEERGCGGSAGEGVRRRPGSGRRQCRIPHLRVTQDVNGGKGHGADDVPPHVPGRAASQPLSEDIAGPGDRADERRTAASPDPRARGSESGVLFSLHRARTDRAASLVNRRTSPRGLTAAERGVHWRHRLERRPKRLDYERVRSLRTQQRAESQCQVTNPFLWVSLG